MTHEYCLGCDPGGYALRHRQAAASRFQRELSWLSGTYRERAGRPGRTGSAI